MYKKNNYLGSVYVYNYLFFLHMLVHLCGSGGRNGIEMGRFVISDFAICLFWVTDDACDAYYTQLIRINNSYIHIATVCMSYFI